MYSSLFAIAWSFKDSQSCYICIYAFIFEIVSVLFPLSSIILPSGDPCWTQPQHCILGSGEVGQSEGRAEVLMVHWGLLRLKAQREQHSESLPIGQMSVPCGSVVSLGGWRKGSFLEEGGCGPDAGEKDGWFPYLELCSTGETQYVNVHMRCTHPKMERKLKTIQ